MLKMQIIYYGHSCFKVSDQKFSIVFDPYQNGSVPGLKLPENICADAVSCSHGHADHNASDLIHLSGKKFPYPVDKIRVPHDDVNGQKRGMSDITMVSFQNTVVTHLGDIGREPTAKEYEQLLKTDILLIPAGGYFTIDAAMAEKIMHRINAKLNILMHYRNGERGYKVLADLAEIQKVIPDLTLLDKNTLLLDTDTISHQTIVMEPCQ